MIETANQKKENITKRQSECKVKSSTMLTDIAFGFESNWLRGWYKFSGTSTQQRKEKQDKAQITFDIQLYIFYIG